MKNRMAWGQVVAFLTWAGDKVVPVTQQELEEIVDSYSNDLITFRLRLGFIVDAETSLTLPQKQFEHAIRVMRKKEQRYLRPGYVIRPVSMSQVEDMVRCNARGNVKRHQDDDWALIEANLRANGVVSEEEAQVGQRYFKRLDADTYVVCSRDRAGEGYDESRY